MFSPLCALGIPSPSLFSLLPAVSGLLLLGFITLPVLPRGSRHAAGVVVGREALRGA